VGSFNVSEKAWKKVRDLLPSDQLPHAGRPPRPNRDVLNAVLWVVKTGAPWRKLPKRYGPWSTIYTRFRAWEDAGVLEEIYEILDVNAYIQELSADTTNARAQQRAASAEKGRERRKKAESRRTSGMEEGTEAALTGVGERIPAKSNTIDYLNSDFLHL
jgi:Transposase and inactivated derivatives